LVVARFTFCNGSLNAEGDLTIVQLLQVSPNPNFSLVV